MKRRAIDRGVLLEMNAKSEAYYKSEMKKATAALNVPIETPNSISKMIKDTLPMKNLQFILLSKGVVYSICDSHMELVGRMLLIIQASLAGLEEINHILESPELKSIDPKRRIIAKSLEMN